MLPIVNSFVLKVMELFLKMTFLMINTVVNQLHLLEINAQLMPKSTYLHVAKTLLLENLSALSIIICLFDVKVLKVLILI